MRVLLVTNGYPTSFTPGLCEFNKDQVESLRGLGLNVSLRIIARSSGGKYSYRDPLRGLPLSEFDLIHCFHGLTYLSVKRRAPKVPIIVSFLNELEYEYQEAPWVVRKILERVTRLALSGHDGAIFKGPIPSPLQGRPATVSLPNGVDEEDFDIIERALARSRLGLRMDYVYVGFVSSKNKNRSQKRRDIFDSTIDYLRGALRGVDADRIEPLILSGLPRDKYKLYLNALDFLLVTSDFEGSPNAVKEALSSGVPVVGRAVGDIERLLDGCPLSKVVGSSDPIKFAEASALVLKAQRLAGRYYRKEIRTAFLEKNITRTKIALSIERFYKDVMLAHGEVTDKL